MRCKLTWCAMVLIAANHAWADAPAANPAATPVPAAAPDPAEEQAVEKLKQSENMRLETEIAAMRAESARQLEEKIAAARAKSEKDLAENVQYLRARRAEERLGIVSTNPGSGGTRVLRQVDRTNSVERSLLLLPQGCLVMQMKITVEGKPLQDEFETIIDEMLAAADANEDGQTTWQEALGRAEFQLGRMASNRSQLAPDKLPALLKQFDANGDGVVARAEARLFLAMASGGNAFTVQTISGANDSRAYLSFAPDGLTDAGTGTQSPVNALIDTDSDGIFNRREMLSASWRLKLRDKNDDDAVEFVELFDTPSPFGFSSGISRRTSATQTMLISLGPLADWEAIWKLLGERYAREGRISDETMPLSKELLAALDKNKSGTLDREELVEMNQTEPQITVEANLGVEPPSVRPARKESFLAALVNQFKPTPQQQPQPKPVEALVVSTSIPGITGSGSIDPTTGAYSIDLPGVRLSIVPDRSRQNWKANLQSQVQSYLQGYDVDKNGYIEKSEIQEEQRKQMESQIDSWDNNSDGKVYPDELESFLSRSQRPQQSRISLAAAEQDHTLFYALDANGDGKLGQRELQAARSRLTALDANRDGRIAAAEVPKAIRLAIGRANQVSQLLQPPGARSNRFMVNGPMPPRTGAGPAWFHPMDVNNDGDVSRREFLGPSDKFAAIDANQDGFIDAIEAVRADTTQKQVAR